jgi:hypothetical protein
MATVGQWQQSIDEMDQYTLSVRTKALEVLLMWDMFKDSYGNGPVLLKVMKSRLHAISR